MLIEFIFERLRLHNLIIENGNAILGENIWTSCVILQFVDYNQILISK